jgi:hypothetical protein
MRHDAWNFTFQQLGCRKGCFGLSCWPAAHVSLVQSKVWQHQGVGVLVFVTAQFDGVERLEVSGLLQQARVGFGPMQG